LPEIPGGAAFCVYGRGKGTRIEAESEAEEGILYKITLILFKMLSNW
jgi:hypothetical protein